MSTHTPREHKPAWSPETETREDVKALLLQRDALGPDQVLVFRYKLFPDIYDTYLETLRCVVQSRGAKGAVEMELVHEALTNFWDETVAGGFTESIQSRLLSLAMGLANNHVRRERRNPATQVMPTSSQETPGSFPKPERAFDLKGVARLLFARLSPEHQAMVALVVWEDLTVSDAARKLGLARRTAASRLTAALTLLNEWAEEILSPSER